MTTSPITATETSDRVTARNAMIPAAIASTAIAVTLSYLGAHDNRERLVELGLQIVAAGVLFGVVVPRGLRQESAGGRALVLGALALLIVVPAFWSGLPIQLGAAACLLGYAGKRADTGSGKAIASLVLGLLAVVAYLAIYVGDFVNSNVIG